MGRSRSRTLILREDPIALSALRRLLWRRVAWPLAGSMVLSAGWAAFAADLAHRLGLGHGLFPPWWAPFPGLAFLFVLFMASGGWFPFIASSWRVSSRGIAIRGQRWATIPWDQVSEWRLAPVPAPLPGLQLSIARRRGGFRRQPQSWSLLVDAQADPDAIVAVMSAGAPGRRLAEPAPAIVPLPAGTETPHRIS